jgi:gliding motility-associated-like protein
MKKFGITILCLLAYALPCFADHISGGEIFYKLIRESNRIYTYRVTVKLYQGCSVIRPFPANAFISIFQKGSGDKIRDTIFARQKTEKIQLEVTDSCINNPPVVCYNIAFYEVDIDLPESENGYILAYMANYRIRGLTNIQYTQPDFGAIFTADIPGNSLEQQAADNNSARFTGSDLVLVCANLPFSYSFSAEDDDGDDLEYYFCAAYNSSGFNPGVVEGIIFPSAPPFPQLPYRSPFSEEQPLGNRIVIDRSTGLISGVAPDAGVYVVTVCVAEIRDGMVIAVQSKDIQINIANCGISEAKLPPSYMLCDSTFSLSAFNLSLSPVITDYFWEVLDKNESVLHSSNLPSLQYTFPDTGAYFLRLYVNDANLCGDTAKTPVLVYPGFKPEFSASSLCINNPTQFTDASTSRYGIVNSWRWDFGEVEKDTSRQRNPAFQYPQQGEKNVSLIAGNSFGCVDTVSKIIDISDKPALRLNFRDTLICLGDTIALRSEAPGKITWRPAGFLDFATGNRVSAFPATNTRYYAEVNDNNCINTDSMMVRVVPEVTLVMPADTIICLGDPIRLMAQSNGIRLDWRPQTGLSNPEILQPMATPLQHTTYTLTTRVGGCVRTDSVSITVVAYPTAFAGNDTSICYNTPVSLLGDGNGSRFEWLPAQSVANPTQPLTNAMPNTPTNFVLKVFDNKGCPKPGTDTVFVFVSPPLNLKITNDTNAIVGVPLSLSATGGLTYQWSPATYLNDAAIPDPVALFTQDHNAFTYKVVTLADNGCGDSATITIRAFVKGRYIYMPTGFTPNGDGLNDILKPTLTAVKKLETYIIFNRYGEIVFETKEMGKGWDGIWKGKPQPNGLFTWMVRVKLYDDSISVEKGTVSLIR